MATDGRSHEEFELPVYKAAFRNIEAPALITDTDLTIRDINQYGRKFLEYEREEIIGCPAGQIAADEEELAELVETISRGKFWSGSFTARTNSGRKVFGRGSAGPVYIDGGVRAYVGVFIDTTKQRQYQNTAEVLNRLLRHDLRNKLNVAHGNLQIVRPFVEDEDAKKALNKAIETVDTINQQAKRARELRRLLERTYEASNQVVRLDYVLNEAVAEVINGIDEANVKFSSFPEVKVIADELLTSVLSSVLENAFVHNDKDTPLVELTVATGTSSVIVSVFDNGPGIPDSQKDIIFGREESNQVHHESGLSLFFADNVIKSYNGDIWVEDNEPDGAVFRIELPMA